MTRKDLNPMLRLAALNIGVHVTGINALKEVSLPVGSSDDVSMGLLERHVKSSLSFWIYKNTNSENHNKILTFIQMQNGILKSNGLNFISRYATLNDAPILANIFISDNDPMVQYGCIHNFCTIFDEHIMTMEAFMKDKDKIIIQWKSLLLSKGFIKLDSNK